MTYLERLIAGIWAEVLEKSRVGRMDNFFFSGGDSLKATMVLSRIRSALGVELPIGAVFYKTTVLELAELAFSTMLELGEVETVSEIFSEIGALTNEEARLVVEEELNEVLEAEEEEPSLLNTEPGLSERVASLSMAKRALFELRFSQASALAEAERKIVRSEGAGPFPLSYSQQKLWFLSKVEPESTAYNISFAVSLFGELSIGALEESLSEIVRRHETLRSVFPDKDGEPFQKLIPLKEIRLKPLDLTDKPGPERKALAECAAREAAGRPFDLASGPLFRMMLAKLGSAEHLLFVTVHHIVFDGWSKEIFLNELVRLYDAFSSSRTSPLAELPIRFSDFAAWQRERLGNEPFQRELSYWKERLGGELTVTELPTLNPRPKHQSYRSSSHTLHLSKELVSALKGLGKETGSTLYMTLLAVFKLLIYRYTNEEDIVVGSPAAGRSHPETESLIGFFINSLVLRTDLSGDPSFRELAARVRDSALGAFENQNIPFEKLVEEINPIRDLSRSPLFQIFFQLRNIPKALQAEKGPEGGQAPRRSLTVREDSFNQSTSPFDLTLDIIEDTGLSCIFKYKTDLFDRTFIEGMAGHFKNLLQAVVENPDKKIFELTMLTWEERRTMLVEWNDTESKYPRDSSIHSLFEAQVELRPDARAVIYEGQEISYGELNIRANRLAHHLRNLGVGPDVIVGVAMERSIEAVTATLAVMKAGGAYLSLEPTLPAKRLAYMLSDSAAKALITKELIYEKLHGFDGSVVCMDRDEKLVAGESEENPKSGVSSENLSYIIYTSGSTGNAKAVLCTHRYTIRRLHWMWETFPFVPGDVCCMKSPLDYVDAGWETYSPLLKGVPVVVIPDSSAKDPQMLVDTLADKNVTRLMLVPSLLSTIIETVEDLKARLPLLKLWISAGEKLSKSLIERFEQSMGKGRLINVYGTTETPYTAWYDTASLRDEGGTVPIGRPTANVRCYVLDPRMNPVPVAVPGELYIGGDGLSRGYLNCPELTEKKFIPNPLSEEPGERLFKTGDIARYLPDGNIEIVGRRDHQVKLRGFRIEPGEIEATLLAQPDVKKAVVILREDIAGDKRLIAYLVPKGKREPLPSELRRFLKGSLPDFMIPAAFVMLNTLPYTSSGKVDRAALPEPNAICTEVENETSLPADGVEERLVAIWEQLLAFSPVGTRDDFFELGGHSLLAARLFSDIEKEFKRRLPLALLFDAPTIEGLAVHLRAPESTGGWSSLVHLKPKGDKAPFFCVHPGSGNVLIFKDLAAHLDPRQPFYALQARGLDGTSAPLESIETMATSYIKEIRTVQPDGPYMLGGHCIGGIIALEMTHQLEAFGEEVSLLVMLEAPYGRMDQWGVIKDGSKEPPSPAMQILYQIKHRQLFGFLLVKCRQKFKGIRKKDPYQIRPIFTKARGEYRMKPYHGRITFFRVSGHIPHPIWHEVALGGLEEHILPGHHRTMLKEPNVRSVAEELGVVIDEALKEREKKKERLNGAA